MSTARQMRKQGPEALFGWFRWWAILGSNQ